MSIPLSGARKSASGAYAAVAKAIRLTSLKPANRIIITFDPFHPKVSETRQFLHFISSKKIIATNPNCIIKTDVVCDRREPTINVKLNPEFKEKFGSEELLLKSQNLNCLEIVQLYNKYILPLVPEEEPATVFKTKSAKKK